MYRDRYHKLVWYIDRVEKSNVKQRNVTLRNETKKGPSLSFQIRNDMKRDVKTPRQTSLHSESEILKAGREPGRGVGGGVFGRKVQSAPPSIGWAVYPIALYSMNKGPPNEKRSKNRNTKEQKRNLKKKRRIRINKSINLTT